MLSKQNNSLSFTYKVNVTRYLLCSFRFNTVFEMDSFVSIEDFEVSALRKLPKNAADYYKSGATAENTLNENKSAFKRQVFHFEYEWLMLVTIIKHIFRFNTHLF